MDALKKPFPNMMNMFDIESHVFIIFTPTKIILIAHR